MTDVFVLFFLIVASGVITVIIGVIGLVKSLANGGVGFNAPTTPEVKVDVHVDAPTTNPVPPYPGIAEQFDGRLTNVVRDPLSGIL